ncbi:hypothetical protein [Pleionea sp. CnH1-48]|uniref:hypothetical protein n=1 Tax=Pleionea sp. CnH1-48 TaxID=2954494 RepID=UPI002096C695|nr:hypothetical protein [Pleionea sp. CnH1-48]MCO7225344.1 hypothetical protein [Pleionea sp. CnH1-48]
MRRLNRIASIALAFGMLGASAQQTVSDQKLRELAERSDMQQYVERIDKLVKSNEVISVSHVHLKRQQWSLLEQRYIRYQTLLRLSQLAATEEAENFLNQQVSIEPEFYRHLKDGAYAIPVPVFPIAARAKNILNRWVVERYSHEIRHLISKQNWSLALSYSQHSKLHHEALLDAIDSSPIYLLSSFEQQVKSVSEPMVAEAALAIGLKLGEHRLVKKAFMAARPVFSVHQVALVRQTFDADLSFNILASLLESPHLFSVAAEEMTNIDRDDSVVTILLPYLSDRRLGGAAAFSLRKILGHEHLDMLSSSFDKTPDRLFHKRLIWILKHSEQPALTRLAKSLTERSPYKKELKEASL